MAYKIEEIEGIGPAYRQKLASANIDTTDDLLSLCASPDGRKSVANRTGINEGQLLKWANMADLMRISGVGRQFSELLEASGVDTVKELRNRRPDNLYQKILETNQAKRLVRRPPSLKQVTNWVDQAKKMTPMVTH